MWTLSEAAVDDLDVMSAWGSLTFGYRLSQRYEQIIVDMFDNLADSPGTFVLTWRGSGDAMSIA